MSYNKAGGLTIISGITRMFAGRAPRQFVSTVEEAEAALQSPGKVVLLGDAVYITLDPLPELPQDYIAVTPVFAFGEAKKLKRYVDKRVAQLLLDRTTSFAVDSYISWGRSQKRDVALLIGGIVKERGTRIELMVFEKGSLREIAERELPEINTKQFNEILRATVQEFSARYLITKTAMVDPLASLLKENDYLASIGQRPYIRTVSFPMRAFLNSGVKMERRSVQINQKSLWTIALSAVALSLAFSGWTLSQAWTDYQEAVTRFDQAAMMPSFKKTRGINSGMLAKMQAHQGFLNTDAPQRRQAVMVHKLAQSVASIPQLSLRSITLLPGMFQDAPGPAAGAPAPPVQPDSAPTAPPIPTGTPMVTMEIVYPGNERESVIQGRELAARLSAISGYPMRIDQQGILASEQQSGMRRWRIDIPYESELTR